MPHPKIETHKSNAGQKLTEKNLQGSLNNKNEYLFHQ